MNLSKSEQKILRAVAELEGDSGADYSSISDLAGDGAVRVVASLELKGLVHTDGGTVKLTSLGAVVLQTYR